MKSLWFLIFFGSILIYQGFKTVSGEEVGGGSQPSYSQCKPYVDAALKGEVTSISPPATPAIPRPVSPSSEEGASTSNHGKNGEAIETAEKADDIPHNDQTLATSDTDNVSGQIGDSSELQEAEIQNASPAENVEKEDNTREGGDAGIEGDNSEEQETGTNEENNGVEDNSTEEEQTVEDKDNNSTQEENKTVDSAEDSKEEEETEEGAAETPVTNSENILETAKPESPTPDEADSQEQIYSNESGQDSKEEKPEGTSVDDGTDENSGEDSTEGTKSDRAGGDNVADKADKAQSDESEEKKAQEAQVVSQEPTESAVRFEATPNQDDGDSTEASDSLGQEASNEDTDDSGEDSGEEEGKEIIALRSRAHLERILGLDGSESTQGLFNLLDKATLTTLKELKSIYEIAIKPLETLYKYRDLSNRHFGDPEIFSKPMVVFMGPWSGGKSSILNWLLGIENHDSALRTGADPSPAQFNIMTHGSEDEVLDGTQLAADWTFSGLQKFGQAFLDRLRGRKLPNRLLEKVNLVEIPGILEVRKQVERSFPFNDACQWFIDRADVLFLIYDPAKLDIGPETEAILDQLKGRENQVRIVLNKADTVKPDELLRLQANLIWNISPLMASAEPPILYVASLWGRPLNPESPTSLLLTHENNFLKDIRDATEKRVETRIAAARRFAVRVRNHGKMCDCYLNTYNNHRSFFSNKKKISDDIIEHPQNYHIYEGLSTLTNISRYDLPDPDTYRDFFRLNPLWEFPTLASTCTYFRGCPINKLDIAIAYELPELLGRFRRQREAIVSAQQPQRQSSKPKK